MPVSTSLSIPRQLRPFFSQLTLPQPDSHKGQNGKLLIIGGSQLFHVASRWSLDVASKFVDMVFYSSVPLNNQLIKEAKQNFWNGIVIPRDELDAYLQEADVVLIGPGMERDEATAELVNQLLSEYPTQKWVIDAGALQVVKPSLLSPSWIITPHKLELQTLVAKLADFPQVKKFQDFQAPLTIDHQSLVRAAQDRLHQPLILLKGAIDYVFLNQSALTGEDSLVNSDGLVGRDGLVDENNSVDKNTSPVVAIEGGNAGMTKGGTGDVLAGLVAALYCTQPIAVAAVVGSYVNKKAGDELYQQVGPYFNASDLVATVPEVLWKLLNR